MENVDEFIPEFVQNFILSIGESRKTSVIKVYSGMLSDIYRVQFTENENAKPLIVKAVRKEVSDQFDVVPAFQREILFYDCVLEELISFEKQQKRTNLLGNVKFNTVIPQLYKPISKSNDCFALEDMAHIGYKRLPTNVITDVKLCESVLIALAKFHSVSFVLKSHNQKSFVKYKHLIHPLYERIATFEKLDDFDGIVHACIDKAINSLEQHESFRIEKLYEMQESVTKQILSYITPEPTDSHGILIHGDLTVTNILFKQNEVCFLDFQRICYGSCILDLMQFLFTSVNSKIRNDSLPKLLRIYYENVCLGIQELSGDPNVLFTWNAFQEQIKRYGGYGFIMTLLQIEYIYSREKDLISEQEAPAVEDTGKLTKSKLGLTFEKNETQQHLAAVVRDIIRLGYM